MSLLLLLIVVVAASGLGALALRRLSADVGLGERLVFAIPLGMGILGYAVLALGLLRLLGPIFLALPLLIGLGAAAATGTKLWGERGPIAPRTPLLLAGTAILAVLGLATLIGAFAPPGGLEWDALSYHLAAPKVYLRAGHIFYIPWSSHTNFPFTLQMLYTMLLGLGSVGAAKACHWLCGVLLVASIYTFSVRHIPNRGRAVGMVAALILASTPIVLWESSVAYVDLATALFTWLALYALFNAAATLRRESVPWLLVSAAMMGLALGTKLTVLGFWGMLLVGILFWHRATTGRWEFETIPHAATWGGLSLLIASPWFVKSWLYTGNPVYPFFFNRFGGRHWNAENAALYAADQAKFGFGKTAVDLLLGPWQATMEAGLITPTRPFIFTEYVVFGLSPVFVALLLAAPFVAKKLSRTAAGLTLFAVGVYAFWFFLMQQTRYLIPALPALAVLGGEVAVALWDEKKIARWGAAGLIAASVVWGGYLATAQIAAPALPAVLGSVPVEAYVASTPGGMRGLMPAIAYINKETPPTAKVALFDEVRGFYLDRPYLWATPNHAELLPWSAYAGVDDWLTDFKRRGYTTLLVSRANGAGAKDGQRWRTLLTDAIEQNKVRMVYSLHGVEVYTVL